MTIPQPVPPAPATPYAPSWCLYIYGTHAFFTYGGRLVAEATVATPAQDARIEGVFHRLVTHTTQQGVPTHDC